MRTIELNIAVVDDIERDRERVRGFIDRYSCDSITAKAEDFVSAEDFLHAYRKGAYQIIFLDICMDEMNGLELAERLRNADNDIAIIFMSTTREFVFESISFEPRGYLCKPYEYDEFADIMDRTLKKLFATEKYIAITMPHSEIQVALSEIVAVLSDNHSIELKMITGETHQSNMLFSEIESILEGEQNFLLCSRGIIVNMDYSSQIKGDVIIMQDGTSYPVRRRGRKEINAKFTTYIARRIRRKLDI